MSVPNMKRIIFYTLLALIVDITALNCVEDSPICSCHFSNGSFYDLNKISSEGIVTTTNFNYTSLFHPCKNVNISLDERPNECNNSTGVSLCVRFNNNLPFSLGNTTETKLNVLGTLPEFTLNHGTNKTHITLNCCPACTATTFHLDSKPDASTFHYILTSRDVCIQHVEGISAGSLLVILLIVFSGVYLLVGALALKFLRGAIGWELIPNYDFWSDLPALVKDGVTFTFSGCSAESYDRI